MITTLTYWWYLLWDLQRASQSAKEFFGVVSTMEIFAELVILTFITVCYLQERK